MTKMVKKIFFNNEIDNLRLYGELSQVNTNDDIAILCHGLHGDIHENGAFDLLVDKLSENNMNVFRFDFRGSGNSEGNDMDVSISGEINDLQSSILYLKKLGYKKFVLLGASFGAGIVSLIKNDLFNNDIKKLVLWYGVLDYMHPCNKAFTKEGYEEAKKEGFYTRIKKDGRKFKYSLQLFDEVYSLKPYKELLQKNIPILFIHGEEDQTIPYEMSETVFKMCNNSEFKLIPQVGHCFRGSEYYRNIAIEETLNFIKK